MVLRDILKVEPIIFTVELKSEDVGFYISMVWFVT